MKLKKKDLYEIIDSNSELIGANDMPEVDANADTQAKNTTDYNAKIGTQPYRYDMLGRFGFTLMPFMEGVENSGQTEMLDELTELMRDNYMETLEYYYRNPNKLKSDFRKASESEYSHESETNNVKWAKKIISVIEKHFKKAFDEPKNIDEGNVVEDKMVDKKNEDEITKRSSNSEIKDKKIEKVAGLINKLDKKDIDKLINLLEINRK